jgi:hypothetical protein
MGKHPKKNKRLPPMTVPEKTFVKGVLQSDEYQKSLVRNLDDLLINGPPEEKGTMISLTLLIPGPSPRTRMGGEALLRRIVDGVQDAIRLRGGKVKTAVLFAGNPDDLSPGALQKIEVKPDA